MKRGRVERKRPDGVDEHVGYLAGGLAACRVRRNWWKIIHVGSGLDACSFGFRNLWQARAAITQILPLTDWTASQEQILAQNSVGDKGLARKVGEIALALGAQ